MDNETTKGDDGFAEWGGYMEAKKMKLRQQFQTIKDKNHERKSEIFKGISISVNGYTKPSASDLLELIAEHGGIYHHYHVPNGGTTHIIASNLPNVKIKKLGQIPIVKPEWIVDSIKSAKLLDYKTYLLYTNQSHTQPALKFSTRNDNLTVLRNQNTSRNTVVSEKRIKDATNPSFIGDFYQNSRLHLISSLGAEFKQLVSDLRKSSLNHFDGLMKLKALDDNVMQYIPSKRVIMHIDMDCFFVSVGLRARPELRGKPVAVTHSQQTGNKDFEMRNSTDKKGSLSEIASCSYEARLCGIKNGMFMGAALKLCPQLIAIPYDFEGYREVSHILYNTMAEYTLDLEAVSCDELYADITNLLPHVSVDTWAVHIRAEIESRTRGCTCSLGFGENRLQARLATRRAKPNSYYHLQPAQVFEYLQSVPLKDLPGVGYSTLAKLAKLGMHTCDDVQNSTIQHLQSQLGYKMGTLILQQSAGIDNKPLQFDQERKSISAEINYGIRLSSGDEVMAFLRNLVKEVHSRLSALTMKCKSITLKLMVRARNAPKETEKYLGHGLCDCISRTSTLTSAVTVESLIFKEIELLSQKLNIVPSDIRGIGIKLSKLEKIHKSKTGMTKFINRSSINHIPERTNDNHIPKINYEHESHIGEVRNNKICTINRQFVDDKFYNESTKSIWTRNHSSTGKEVQKHLQEHLSKESIIYLNNSKNNDIRAPQHQRYMNYISDGTNTETLKTINQQCIVINNTYDLKNILTCWLNLETNPINTDVQIIAEYFYQFAFTGKIDVLNTLLTFVHRKIYYMKSCLWHDVYYNIINEVQKGMLKRYNYTLIMSNRTFPCLNHN